MKIPDKIWIVLKPKKKSLFKDVCIRICLAELKIMFAEGLSADEIVAGYDNFFEAEQAAVSALYDKERESETSKNQNNYVPSNRRTVQEI